MINMQFIEASFKDIQIIQQLATEIWWDHYPSIIGEKQVEFMLGAMYDQSSLEKQMKEGHQFYLAVQGKEVLGFSSIKEEGVGEWFLNKFYLKTNQQNQGLGSAFYNFLVEKTAAEKFRLQVNRQNYKAINFYFKNGFIIEKVADFDIGSGYFMNDFIMLWNKRK